MTKARHNKLANVRAVIQQCEEDAEALDGRPFDAKTVASIFGETLANIHALARIVEAMLEDE